MANSRPIQFVHYACGHSTPVRGTGASVNRWCEVCTRTGRINSPGLGEITLRDILGIPNPRKRESPNV